MHRMRTKALTALAAVPILTVGIDPSKVRLPEEAAKREPKNAKDVVGN